MLIYEARAKEQLNGLRQQYRIFEYERGLLYEHGRFVRELQPGRYIFWRWQGMSITLVNQRQSSQTITAQEMLTADRVDVRVTLIAQYRISNVQLAVNSVEKLDEQIYQDLQLALREQITSRELDTLLNDRSEMGEALLAEVKPRAEAYGVELSRVGVKDIILPGVIRNMMQQEVQADRAGRADLIQARHEVAALRTRANLAKIMQENPQLKRTEELEALKALAYGQGNVIVLPNMNDLVGTLLRPVVDGNEQQ